jgi:hypothetical protein
MFNKKYYKYIFAGVMSLFMGLFMSFVMVLINVGFVDNFHMVWLRAFIIGSCVAFPTAILIAPLANRIAAHLTKDKNE